MTLKKELAFHMSVDELRKITEVRDIFSGWVNDDDFIETSLYSVVDETAMTLNEIIMANNNII